MVISLCNWGFGEPWKWGPKIAHTWRVTFDIKPNENSIKSIAEVGEKLKVFSGPNKWNDLDMLEIGNGISDELSRYHFEAWCRLRSPLILGCDLRKIYNGSPLRWIVQLLWNTINMSIIKKNCKQSFSKMKGYLN